MKTKILTFRIFRFKPGTDREGGGFSSHLFIYECCCGCLYAWGRHGRVYSFHGKAELGPENLLFLRGRIINVPGLENRYDRNRGYLSGFPVICCPQFWGCEGRLSLH